MTRVTMKVMITLMVIHVVAPVDKVADIISIGEDIIILNH